MIQVIILPPDLFTGNINLSVRCLWQETKKELKNTIMQKEVNSVVADMIRQKIHEVLKSLLSWRENANESYGTWSSRQLKAAEMLKANLPLLKKITDIEKFAEYIFDNLLPHFISLTPSEKAASRTTYQHRLKELDNYCTKMLNNPSSFFT